MLFLQSLLVGAAFSVASANAFTLAFYEGTQCNGAEVANLQISNPDVCTTEYLDSDAESVLITRESSDNAEAEIAFYSDNACNTSNEAIIDTSNGCVDYSGLGAMSYVIEQP